MVFIILEISYLNKYIEKYNFVLILGQKMLAFNDSAFSFRVCVLTHLAFYVKSTYAFYALKPPGSGAPSAESNEN